jgi:hypothetical protein
MTRLWEKAIRVPREDATEASFFDLSNHLIENWALCSFFCRVRFALNLNYIYPIPLG